MKVHPKCEDVIETTTENVATCTVIRRGQTPVERSFSEEDAKRAGLWGKQGPWTNYPKRMLQMRARGFALRDSFPDALRGMALAEEAQDTPPVEREVNGELVARETPEPRSADDQLAEKLQETVDLDEQQARSFEQVVNEAEVPDIAIGAYDDIKAIATPEDANALHAELRERGKYAELDPDTKRDIRKAITKRMGELVNAK